MANPRKPRELKIIEGTYRPDRENLDEPIPTDELGAPPDGMTTESSEIWDDIARAAFWLKDADRPTLERYCTLFAIWRAVAAEVLENGSVQVTPNGYESLSGAFQVMMSTEKHLQKLGSVLGFDPVCRSKIKTGARPDPDNPWAQFKKF